MKGNPRYAIVRVDNNCPFMQEKFDFSSCSKMFNCDKFVRCEKCKNNCRYGDTKEQLIKKITTALRREKIKRGLTYYWLATKIVEFLGVEE